MTAQDNARKAAEEIVDQARYWQQNTWDPEQRIASTAAIIFKHFPSPPSSAGERDADEREAFEAWARDECTSIDLVYRSDPDVEEYHYQETRNALAAWQARAEISRALRSVTTTPDGWQDIATEACRKCGGTGMRLGGAIRDAAGGIMDIADDEECRHCKGTGTVKSEETAEVHILIDGRGCTVFSDWCAREIKHHCGIDQAKELARIRHTGLTDIGDDEVPDYSNPDKGLRFMTHARRGSSA